MINAPSLKSTRQMGDVGEIHLALNKLDVARLRPTAAHSLQPFEQRNLAPLASLHLRRRKEPCSPPPFLMVSKIGKPARL